MEKDLFCQKSGHTTFHLDMICIDKSCKHKGLLCHQCIKEESHEHMMREIVPLIKFIDCCNTVFDSTFEKVSSFGEKQLKAIRDNYHETKRQFEITKVSVCTYVQNLFDDIEEQLNENFKIMINEFEDPKNQILMELDNSRAVLRELRSGPLSLGNNIINEINDMIKYVERDPKSKEIVFSGKLEEKFDYKPKENKLLNFKTENSRLKQFVNKMENWKSTIPKFSLQNLNKYTYLTEKTPVEKPPILKPSSFNNIKQETANQNQETNNNNNNSLKSNHDVKINDPSILATTKTNNNEKRKTFDFESRYLNKPPTLLSDSKAKDNIKQENSKRQKDKSRQSINEIVDDNPNLQKVHPQKKVKIDESHKNEQKSSHSNHSSQEEKKIKDSSNKHLNEEKKSSASQIKALQSKQLQKQRQKEYLSSEYNPYDVVKEEKKQEQQQTASPQKKTEHISRLLLDEYKREQFKYLDTHAITFKVNKNVYLRGFGQWTIFKSDVEAIFEYQIIKGEYIDQDEYAMNTIEIVHQGTFRLIRNKTDKVHVVIFSKNVKVLKNRLYTLKILNKTKNARFQTFKGMDGKQNCGPFTFFESKSSDAAQCVSEVKSGQLPNILYIDE